MPQRLRAKPLSSFRPPRVVGIPFTSLLYLMELSCQKQWKINASESNTYIHITTATTTITQNSAHQTEPHGKLLRTLKLRFGALHRLGNHGWLFHFLQCMQ